MASRLDRSQGHSQSYRLRMLLSIMASQLVIIAFVNWWPNLILTNSDELIYNTRGQDLIALEEIQPTRHAKRPPPPPSPLIPILVEDDIIIEEEVEIEDQFLILDEYGDQIIDQTALSDASGSGATSKAADRGPKELRFVEPEWPRAARRKRIRADVIVEVLVDEKGLVQDAKVVERYLYKGDSEDKERVNELQYGLEEAAVNAAMRWMFQPARQDGNAVKSYKTITFSFGR